MKLSRTETPLESLITQAFDADQIWEELQLQNGVMYENLVSSISKLIAHSSHIHNAQAESEDEDETKPKMESAELSSEEDEDDSEIEFEGNQKSKKKTGKPAAFKPQTYSKSIVDDKFFNLAQMTEFLEKVESQIEAERDPSVSKDESDSEEDIDMFEDLEEGESNAAEGEDNDEGNGNVFYNDFFDRPLDEEESEEVKSENEENSSEDGDADEEVEGKSVRFNLEEDEDEDEENQITTEDEDEKDLEEALPIPVTPAEDLNPSNFEKRAKKIEENIKLMEEEALEPKAWQFQGEVTAERRPENSLLEEHLIFDHLLRQGVLCVFIVRNIIY